MSKKDVPEGFFLGKDGELQPDRRTRNKDRRNRSHDVDGERRNMIRRKSDSEFLKREHEREIEDALEDFAEDHDQ